MTTNGTLDHGTSAFATGKFGQALSGGVYTVYNTAALFGAQSASLGTGTVECWVKTTATAAIRVATGRSGSWWMGMDTTGLPLSKPGGTSVTLTGGTAINDGAWHHLALTLNAGAATLYCDGAQVATNATALVNSATASNKTEIGGFDGGTQYDWSAAGGGMIDEVRFSSVVRYTGTTYTVPTAPFTTDANTVALYHLDGDVTDTSTVVPTAPGQVTGLTATAGNGQAVLAWSAPASDGGSALTDYLVEYQPSGGSWTTFADGTSTATTATVTGLTNGTAYAFRVSAINAIGTGTASATASATPAVTATPGTFLPTDANLLFSPYNWDITSARALTNCSGAYFRALVAGSPTAITLNFDISSLTSTYPTQIKYRVDRGAWTVAPLAATVSVAIPSETSAWTKHLVEVVMKSHTESVNRWASPYATAVKFTSISVTPTTCTLQPIQAAPLKGIVYGDSITEGINTLSGAGDTTNRSDGTLSYAYLLREQLGAEVAVVGFGSQGISKGGNGSVPAFESSWNFQAASIARTFPTGPDFVVINQGQNNGTTDITATYTGVLNAMLSTFPATTKILCMRPLSGLQAANVQAAVAACTKPSRVTYVDTTGWWASGDSTDGVHPFGYADATQIGPRLAAAVRTAIGGTSGRHWLNVGGVAKAI